MMSDKDRLRRLDALFAERVMGHTIQPAHRSMTSYDGGPPVVVGESATGDYGCYYGSIPRYTQSIDAAWEGLQTIHLDRSEIRKITLWDDTSEGSKPYHASVWGAKSGGHGYADHPAEALVLACLRAVGCSEEEMK